MELFADRRRGSTKPQEVNLTLRIVSAVLLTIISLGVATAKTSPKQDSQSASQNKEHESGLVVIVVDSQGAVVAGSNVILSRIKGEKNEPATKGSTDSGGHVQFNALRAGEYSLTVEAPFFITSAQTITLEAKKVLSLNIQLTVNPNGATTIVLDGCDMSPLIHTEAQVTHTVEGRRLQYAPTPISITSAPPRPLRQ
ncbi:MAG TPA: carboxypeptidase-like regulatory domain-containing protein [Candidatus Angelobacter sp.]|nr:carboxypeptidase-like regulatory domain-containing protein [Candidatus Angelobacter sp.]